MPFLLPEPLEDSLRTSTISKHVWVGVNAELCLHRKKHHTDQLRFLEDKQSCFFKSSFNDEMEKRLEVEPLVCIRHLSRSISLHYYVFQVWFCSKKQCGSARRGRAAHSSRRVFALILDKGRIRFY